MAKAALATLESALRDRKLDRTLTTALPPLERIDPSAYVPTVLPTLDAHLRSGVPRGQMSEIVGPRSSGRTTLALQLLAAATRDGELVAFVDTFDRLDVASLVAAGADVSRVLWIRGLDSGRALSPFARHCAGPAFCAGHAMSRTDAAIPPDGSD